MNLMDKLVFTFVEFSLLAMGSINLISIGSDYRHWLAAGVGSLLAVTRMKLSKTEKVINSFGGFSVSSFLSPAICEHYNILPDGNKGVAIFFAVGFVGMLILSIIIDILNNTRGQVPTAVSTLSKAAINKLKSILGMTSEEGDSEQKEE